MIQSTIQVTEFRCSSQFNGTGVLSSHELSSPLNVPESAVSGIIADLRSSCGLHISSGTVFPW